MVRNERLEPPIRPLWLDLRKETPLEPDTAIIDAHHHLWDRPAWRYLFGDLLEDLDCGHRIVGTVFVQCRAMYRASGPDSLRSVGETEFVNGVAAMSASGGYGPTAVCAGIVGHADLLAGAAVEDVLVSHVRAGNGRFRGIRQISAWDDDPETQGPANAATSGMLSEPSFRGGFARLAPLQLSFDAWMFSPQIYELAELARAFPDTTIILNHIGTPLAIGRYATHQAEVFAIWRASIQALSRYPNVMVKLGGLGQRLNGFDFPSRPAPPSSEVLAKTWRPYFETCIDAFTPARCMFESNFPVDKESYSYGVFWNACKRITSQYSDREKSDLLSATAARAYRLDSIC